MPQEERIFGPHEGETYRQYRERLRDDESLTASRAAALMATAMLMKGRANKPMDREAFYDASKKLQSQSSFRRMMKDLKATALLQNGDAAGLLGLFAEKEAERQRSFARYQRPTEYVRGDAQILDAALARLESSPPGTQTPEERRREPFYREMMKRLRQAKTLADDGIQLTGEQTKELVGVCMAYHDAGKKYLPGGEREAHGKTEVMCVLSRYLPEKEFRSYCRRINKAHGDLKPAEQGYTDPEAYPPDRLTGGARTAEEWYAQSRERLTKQFSPEGCAEAAALQKLSSGNPQKVIRQEELDREIARFSAPTSALSRVLRDETAREALVRLSTEGRTEELGTELLTAARKHSARAAQWQVNRSVRALTSGPVNTYAAAENLANILAARALAAGGDAGEMLTNDAFRARAERLRADPAFQRLADRYSADPAFRREINRGLSADGKATALAEAYQKEKAPVREREAAAERVPEAHEPEIRERVPAI